MGACSSKDAAAADPELGARPPPVETAGTGEAVLAAPVDACTPVSQKDVIIVERADAAADVAKAVRFGAPACVCVCVSGSGRGPCDAGASECHPPVDSVFLAPPWRMCRGVWGTETSGVGSSCGIRSQE